MNNWFEERHAPLPGTYLCRTSEIEAKEVREFCFGENSPFSFRLFIYNDEGEFKAFRNSCPHYNVPLNYTPGDVFTSDKSLFLCMTHFAKFDVHNGLCVEGPCKGQSLDLIPLNQDGDQLYIAPYP